MNFSENMEENNDEINTIDIKNLINVFVRNKLLIAKIIIIFFLEVYFIILFKNQLIKANFKLFFKVKDLVRN